MNVCIAMGISEKEKVSDKISEAYWEIWKSHKPTGVRL